MAFKGTHNVQSRGSKAWRQLLKVSPKQRVTKGTILVEQNRYIKAGSNTYMSKNRIHAAVDGTVEIKNKHISIKSAA